MNKSGYSFYNKKYTNMVKHNTLDGVYPKLPDNMYDIIYCDPPWDYNGKMQYDNSSIKDKNIGFTKDIFISSASFKYPTLTLSQLKQLDVSSISNDDCILFMWTTGPQMANAIELGISWGFEYKTVAFVWDKMVHNPGHYTLSQTEFVLAFKKGKFPSPRGSRNIRQLIQKHRGVHSEKPIEIIKNITEMFPTQKKIELFARNNYEDWDNWGLEIPDSEIKILSLQERKRGKLFGEST